MLSLNTANDKQFDAYREIRLSVGIFSFFSFKLLVHLHWVVRTGVLRLEEKNMANITCVIPEINSENKTVPQEQLQGEADYIRAQRILQSIFENGLISLSEFNKITLLNRQSFSPALASIMPDNR